MGWLLQCAIGLRAAVSIAAERERRHVGRAVDEPTEPGEIVPQNFSGQPERPAVDGGCHGLGMDPALITGAVSLGEYVEWIAANATAGALMAAIGVRRSSHCQLPPRP